MIKKISLALFLSGYALLSISLGYQNNSKESDPAEIHIGERPPPDWEQEYLKSVAQSTALSELNNIDDILPTPAPPTPTPIPPAPTPVPTLPPVSRPAQAASSGGGPGQLTREEMVALLSVYDWNIEEALSTSYCESMWRPGVVSITGIHNGLFQVTHGSFDPATNIAQAYAKYLDGASRGNRWYHWNNFGSCGHFY